MGSQGTYPRGCRRRVEFCFFFLSFFFCFFFFFSRTRSALTRPTFSARADHGPRTPSSSRSARWPRPLWRRITRATSVAWPRSPRAGPRRPFACTAPTCGPSSATRGTTLTSSSASALAASRLMPHKRLVMAACIRCQREQPSDLCAAGPMAQRGEPAYDRCLDHRKM